LDLHEILRKAWQWTNEQRLNFGGDPVHCLDTGIVFPDSSLLGDMENG